MYETMDDVDLTSETELDEESINWVQLGARILSGLLLLVIIVSFALGLIRNQKMLILSGIAAGVLCLIFICTFGFSGMARKFCVSKYRNEFRATLSLVNPMQTQQQQQQQQRGAR